MAPKKIFQFFSSVFHFFALSNIYKVKEKIPIEIVIRTTGLPKKTIEQLAEENKSLK